MLFSISYYNKRLYNTRLGEECIVYDFDLKPVLKGAYKAIEVDWSEGLIATEHNGIHRLFDYAELQAMEQHPMTMQEWIDESRYSAVISLWFD